MDGNNTPVNQETGVHYPSSDTSTAKYANLADMSAGS
jgi:hypothetical protein